MLIRLLAIALCVSLVGSSVVPAGMLRCCCKARIAAGNALESTGSCCAPRAVSVNTEASKGVGSCCGQSSGIGTCAVPSSVSPVCPACRCLEQMKVVSIACPTHSEEAPRISLKAALSVDTLGLQLTARVERAVFDTGTSSSLPVILQSCSFRI
jgi:hypothetical protein